MDLWTQISPWAPSVLLMIVTCLSAALPYNLKNYQDKHTGYA